MVFVDGRSCDTRGRSLDRWTQAEVHAAARALGIPTHVGRHVRKMDGICQDLARAKRSGLSIPITLGFMPRARPQAPQPEEPKPTPTVNMSASDQRLAAMNANRNSLRRELADIKAQLAADTRAPSRLQTAATVKLEPTESVKLDAAAAAQLAKFEAAIATEIPKVPTAASIPTIVSTPSVLAGVAGSPWKAFEVEEAEEQTPAPYAALLSNFDMPQHARQAIADTGAADTPSDEQLDKVAESKESLIFQFGSGNWGIVRASQSAPSTLLIARFDGTWQVSRVQKGFNGHWYRMSTTGQSVAKARAAIARAESPNFASLKQYMGL